MTRRAVVLLSGGLDSATALAVARAQGFETHALSFRYGQRHVVELDCARTLAGVLGAARHVIADIDLRVFGRSALTADIDVPKGRDPRRMDADRYLVSVRFTGVIRDGTGEPDESFDEIWHLTKSRQGGSGWVLSGIQQVS